MKLENRILGMLTFKEVDGITYKLCTKCQLYHPMTDEYFPRRSNVDLDPIVKNVRKRKKVVEFCKAIVNNYE